MLAHGRSEDTDDAPLTTHAVALNGNPITSWWTQNETGQHQTWKLDSPTNFNCISWINSSWQMCHRNQATLFAQESPDSKEERKKDR
jgi:hypothetical protein